VKPAKPSVLTPASDAKEDLKSLPLSEVEKKLESSPDGLTQAEAQKRLVQYGPNEVAEQKTNPLLKFLGYFWGPIPWMIEVAVILSGVVRHWPDFFIILFLLAANAVVGFWEERQAGNAIAALKAKLAINARAHRVFHLDHLHLQTLSFLLLSVAGHLTIFLTRTRGPFWSIRPAKILLVAVFGTQAMATLIAVYGLFMPAISWGWAFFVWGYALVWFLVSDRVKLLAYRIFDLVKAGSELETKPKTSPDLTPQIAKATL